MAALSNFVTRIVIFLRFVLLVVLLPGMLAFLSALIWGFLLLTGVAWLVARERGANAMLEICKHLGVAAAVVALSPEISILILTYLA